MLRRALAVLLLWAAAGGCASAGVSFANATPGTPLGIRAWEYRPEGAGPFPALVLLHGCHGVSTSTHEWGRWFRDRGYVALAVDSWAPRGIGYGCDANTPDLPSTERFDDAAGEYKRFVELYPYNRIASYAQYQLAMCAFKQIDSPDRTPEHAEKALAEFEALLSRYPQSPYADETREKIAVSKDHLAEHEYLIGQFYYKKGAYQAALSRFDHLLGKYAHAKVEPSAS